MVTVGYIQGLREPTAAPSGALRNRGIVVPETAPTGEDRVEISPEAREASAVARLAAEIKDSEIREKRVEEAKQRLEEGTYRLVEIVNVVAARISGVVNA